MCGHFLFLFLVKKPNLVLLSKFVMGVMYDSFSSCFVETELLGVSVPIKFYVKSVTNDFVDDSLVNNVIDNSDTFIEADMMIGRKE